MINNRNVRSSETEHTIQTGNRAYYKHKNITKSKVISRETKTVYRLAIRPVVTYEAETMILTKDEEEKLSRFGKKIVRKIYGPNRVIEGVYQRLMNSEVWERLQGEDVVKVIKTQRLRNIRRIGEEKIVKKVRERKSNFRRTGGRPKNRREEQLLEDIKRIRIHNWREKIRDRK